MTKLQLSVILSAVALFFVLYFGCETKPPEQEAIERSRSLAIESTDISILRSEARETLSPATASSILILEQGLENTLADTGKVEVLKELSSAWFGAGHPAIAGYYAEEIANISGTEESWSIAGTTYAIGAQRAEEAKVRNFSTNRAIQALENAISLNPQNTQHQVNLALVYAEDPPQDNPMRGVQMLLDLNQKEPENVFVLLALARLAIRTGQYERAATRLETIIELEPANAQAICLLADVYQNLDRSEAGAMANRCTELSQ